MLSPLDHAAVLPIHPFHPPNHSAKRWLSIIFHFWEEWKFEGFVQIRSLAFGDAYHFWDSFANRI
jgi:hypothetical protein